MSFYLIFVNVGGCYGSLCLVLIMCVLVIIIGELLMGDEDDGICVLFFFKLLKDRY